MDQINEFLQLGVSQLTKEDLLKTIDKLKNDPAAEDEEMIFNVYIPTFSKRKEEIEICNDILPDIPCVSLSFEVFRRILLAHKPE